MSVEELAKNVESNVKQLLKNGDVQGATSAIISTASALNSQADTSRTGSESKKDAEEKKRERAKVHAFGTCRALRWAYINY